MSSKIRAQFHQELEAQKPIFLEIFEIMQSQGKSHWYNSLWVERREKENFAFNPKAESHNESQDQGIVLRIFDGVSLFEEATDDFSPEGLRLKTHRFVHKVLKDSQATSTEVAYAPPTWSQRLSVELEEEITCQIPHNVEAEAWVHFGTPWKKEMFSTKAEGMAFGKAAYDRLNNYKESLPNDDAVKAPDYLMVMNALQRDHFLFIDRESRMTQSLLRNRAVAMAIKGGDRGLFLGGGVGGLETLELSDKNIENTYSDLRKQIQADRLTPGRYKVLMAPPITGVFAHEAFGHSQEADTWARGRSKARELYESQEKVGNQHATILNNPAIYKNGEDDFAAWGSYYFDEEGWLAREQYLVKEGYLHAPMTNLTSALRLNVPRTANGKRECWTNAIYARQTNTYFSAGEKTYDELISMVDYGFLAQNCNGGMEDPKGMGIQVGMAFVEEIKDGKLTGKTFKAPNGGAVQLTGYVPDYLNSIIDKSKIEAFSTEPDKEVHPWNEVGGCGKYHKESVNAGCGGTYLLIDNCHLG